MVARKIIKLRAITSEFASEFCERLHVTICYSMVLRSQMFAVQDKKMHITCGLVRKKLSVCKKDLIGDLPIRFFECGSKQTRLPRRQRTSIYSLMEKCLTHAVVNEYDEIAHICELYKYKMANSELPKLKKIIPRYYKPRTPASKKCKHLTSIKAF